VAADIVIVYAYLDSLASSAQQTADLLDGASAAMNLTFPGNSPVTHAYDEFLDNWDRHREKLHAGVAGVAQALSAVSEAFKAAEDELIAALNGG
jgi:hypothetical protein